MSDDYELPPTNSDEYRRWAASKDGAWDKLADGVLEKDLVYQAWKRRHWAIYGTISGASAVLFMWAAIAGYDRHHPNPRAFAGTFVVAGLILAYAGQQDAARVRTIAMREWSRKRDEELGHKNA